MPVLTLGAITAAATAKAAIFGPVVLKVGVGSLVRAAIPALLGRKQVMMTCPLGKLTSAYIN